MYPVDLNQPQSVNPFVDLVRAPAIVRGQPLRLADETQSRKELDAKENWPLEQLTPEHVAEAALREHAIKSIQVAQRFGPQIEAPQWFVEFREEMRQEFRTCDPFL